MSSTTKRAPDETTGRTKQALMYLRVSSKRQMDTDADLDPDGNSIDTQRRVCLGKVRQMGLVVPEDGIFIEPGNSAQTIDKRPVFRQLLARLAEQRDAEYVIVYTFSRAFRNRLDEALTKHTLQKLGVRIVSAKEDFGEGFVADAMEGVLAVFNELQVRMSGADIKVKMANKARNGGTIGRAKLGYLNRSTEVDGRKVNTVVFDPDRAPLIRMAWETFATGDHTIQSLQRHMEELGLRTRATGRWPSQPVSTSKLGAMLRDRYYLGKIEYEGIEYDGRHEPLVDSELFERVQRILDAHQGAGTRQRLHHHYLKGVVWCGRCHQRLILQRANGNGGEYFYFFCIGRQTTGCDLPYLPTDQVEDLIVAFYQREVRLAPDFMDAVQAAGREAVQEQTALDRETTKRSHHRLTVLDGKESYLLDLAAEQGWPKDMLRNKIDEIRRERDEIQRTLTTTTTKLEVGRRVLALACDLLARPGAGYNAANDVVRAALNRAIVGRIEIDADSVTEHRWREPFDVLMAEHAQYRSTAPQHRDSQNASGRRTQNGPLGPTLSGRGSSRPVLVELRGFEPLTPSMRTRCATGLRHSPRPE
jgi:site-specific DNA recombinase